MSEKTFIYEKGEKTNMKKSIFILVPIILLLVSSFSPDIHVVKGNIKKQSFFSEITDSFRNLISDFLSKFKKGNVEVEKIKAPDSKYISQKANMAVVFNNPEDVLKAESDVTITTGQNCETTEHILLEPKENKTLKLTCTVENFNFKVKSKVGGSVKKVKTVSVKNPIEVNSLNADGNITCVPPRTGRQFSTFLSCEGPITMDMNLTNKMSLNSIRVNVKGNVFLSSRKFRKSAISLKKRLTIGNSKSEKVKFDRRVKFKMNVKGRTRPYQPGEGYLMTRPLRAEVTRDDTSLFQEETGPIEINVTFPQPEPEPEQPEDPRRTCRNSGGSIDTVSCCKNVGNFPNTCEEGACACSPKDSHEVFVCRCSRSQCFNGEKCVDAGILSILPW